MLELKNSGLVEMSIQEVQEIDGGINPVLATFAASLAWDIISCPSAAGAAFSRGFSQWN